MSFQGCRFRLHPELKWRQTHFLTDPFRAGSSYLTLAVVSNTNAHLRAPETRLLQLKLLFPVVDRGCLWAGSPSSIPAPALLLALRISFSFSQAWSCIYEDAVYI